MFNKYIIFLENLLSKFGLSDNLLTFLSEAISLLTLVFVTFVIYYIVFLAIRKSIHIFIERSHNKRDDILIKNNVFKRLCLLVPAYLIRFNIEAAIPSYPTLASTIILFTKIYEVFIYSRVLDAILTTLNDIYNTYEISKSKPIKGFTQVLKTIIYIICILLIIAILTHKELSNILIGLGTLSAVLMLVFKDPILGFVGGLQLTINDMLRIGDWIVMDKSKADGEVLEIGLTTVKVQNWDKTITTVPPYALVNDSFQNWRGMFDIGGRRVKRSINIDMHTVRFCTEEEMAYYKQQPWMEGFEATGKEEVNLYIFRHYVMYYLTHHPKVNQDMIMTVRQLQPTAQGMPIELYFFSANTAWLRYEHLQAEVFDHVLAMLHCFDLKVFQSPTGLDLQILARD